MYHHFIRENMRKQLSNHSKEVIMLDNFQLNKLNTLIGFDRIVYLLEVFINTKDDYDCIIDDSYEEKNYEKTYLPDIFHKLSEEYKMLESSDLLKANYGTILELKKNTEVALKVLNDLYYENKISISDDELKEMSQTLQELLTEIRNQENHLYRFKLFNLNECLSNFIIELQSFLDYVLFFKDTNTEIVDSLDGAYTDYRSNLNSYNDQCMSDGYNKTGSENQDVIENEKLKKKGLKIISAILKQKDFIENSELKERALKIISQSKRCISETLPFKIYVKTSEMDPNWNYLGYGETIQEAYFYVLNNEDAYSISDELYKFHVCCAPGEDPNIRFLKIVSAFFTEYYDTVVDTNLLGHFGFRKAESKCIFCKKKIEGYGNACSSIKAGQHIFTLIRCCNECHEKFIFPLRSNFKAEMNFLINYMNYEEI